MEGYVKIADDDNDPTNNLPLTTGTITLHKLSGSDNSLQRDWNTTLDAAGHYRLEILPTGEYDVTISAPGYMTVEQRIRISGTGTTFYNFTVELVPNTMSGLGSASGTVTDAVTGALVPGMTLRIYKGLYIGVEEPAGDPVQTLMTDTEGNYAALALDAGIYTVFVIDNRMGLAAGERYLVSSFPIKILGNKTIGNQNGTVSKSLSGTQLRIVLTWGSAPKDLDSHMYINTASGSTAHTYYYSKTFQQYGETIVNLDRDTRESFGPETTTIYTPVEGTYTFYVHDFSNRSEGATDTALSLSGAVVTVYSGTSALPLQVYSVPVGYGTTWKVFSYDTETASITDYNTIMADLP